MALKPDFRLGLFGGAFDPPHNAHVTLATAAVAQLGLDQLRIFPTGQAWHKSRGLSPPEQRLAMARLAFGDLPATVVDDREIRRAGPTYTVDTLRELHAEFPQVRLVLVMGADQANALTSWHEWEEILRLAIISIADRAPAAGQTAPPAPWTRLPGTRLEPLSLPLLDVSATRIRAQAAIGGDIGALVPAPVARYIEQHHLYQPA
jgi:nicotinate-nucleotide adenylyltransferase